MQCGSRANDRGLLLFSETEKTEFIRKEPKSEKYFKQVIGAQEFINNIKRYALWLVDIKESELNSMRLVLDRISEIKKFRDKTPHLFGSIRKPQSKFLFIPQMSSENRDIIPMGFLDANIIPLDPHFFIDKVDLYHFGILTSKMHNTWIRCVCGRLKSDLRYSNSIVYNNYPFPENVSEAQKRKVETTAQAILDSREIYTSQGKSLADLYDPLSMPKDLKEAHDALDKAVDDCYGKTKFTSDAKRVTYLFELYDKLIKK